MPLVHVTVDDNRQPGHYVIQPCGLKEFHLELDFNKRKVISKIQSRIITEVRSIFFALSHTITCYPLESKTGKNC